MYWKIPKNTPLFAAVMAVKKRMDECTAAADALASELNAQEVYQSNYYLAGGIAGLRFSSKPEGWKQVGSHYGVYLPKAALKDLCARIAALPKVQIKEMATVLQYKTHTRFYNGGFYRSRLPDISFLPSVVLMKTRGRAPYTGIPGMIEMLGSEYDTLHKKTLNAG